MLPMAQHQPTSRAQTDQEISLAPSSEMNLLSAARARAFTRLHERRVLEREESACARSPDRREILSCVIHGGALAAAWTLLGRSMLADRSPAGAPSGGVDTGATRGVLREPGIFAWESALFQSGQYALAALCNHLKLPTGNATLRSGELSKSVVVSVVERFEQDPLLSARLYGTVAWLAPVSEEVLFRLIPHAFLHRDEMGWEVGLPFNIAFAGIHNLVDIRQETKRSVELSDTLKLSLDTVPLSQFMLGAFCWYVMRRYGELAPILAHSLNNHAPAFALIWGGRGTLSDFNALLAEELAVDSGERGMARGAPNSH